MQIKNIGFSPLDGKLFFTKQYLREQGYNLHSEIRFGVITDLGTLPEPNAAFLTITDLTYSSCLVELVMYIFTT